MSLCVVEDGGIGVVVVPDVGAEAAVVAVVAGHCVDAQGLVGVKDAGKGAALVAFFGDECPSGEVLGLVSGVLDVNVFGLFVYCDDDDARANGNGCWFWRVGRARGVCWLWCVRGDGGVSWCGGGGWPWCMGRRGRGGMGGERGG